MSEKSGEQVQWARSYSPESLEYIQDALLQDCPECYGSGQEDDTSYPCTHCYGEGYI